MVIETWHVHVALIGLGLLAICYCLVLLQEWIWARSKSVDKKKLARSALDGVAASAARLKRASNSREAAEAKQRLLLFGKQHWGFGGRTRRAAFLLHQIIATVTFGSLAAIGYILFFEAYGAFKNHSGFVLLVISTVSWVWFTWAISARRMRDTGVSAWWTLVLLIPPVNLAATAFLLFVPTNEFEGRGI